MQLRVPPLLGFSGGPVAVSAASCIWIGVYVAVVACLEPNLGAEVVHVFAAFWLKEKLYHDTPDAAFTNNLIVIVEGEGSVRPFQYMWTTSPSLNDLISADSLTVPTVKVCVCVCAPCCFPCGHQLTDVVWHCRLEPQTPIRTGLWIKWIFLCPWRRLRMGKRRVCAVLSLSPSSTTGFMAKPSLTWTPWRSLMPRLHSLHHH